MLCVYAFENSCSSLDHYNPHRESLLRMTQGDSTSNPVAVAVSEGATQSLEQLYTAFLGLDYSDDGYVKNVVDANYDKCTLEFLELLGDRLVEPETSDNDKTKIKTIQRHIQTCLQERMGR